MNGRIETYELTVEEEYPGLFRLQALGAGPLAGAVIVTHRNEISAYMSGDSLGSRSLGGHLEPESQVMSLQGVDQNGGRITIRAVRE